MNTSRLLWPLTGLAAGVAGLATSYFAADALDTRATPVVAVADLVVRHTPGGAAETVISSLGHGDKPFLLTVIYVLLAIAFAGAGVLARRSTWLPLVVFVVLAVVGGVATATESGVSGVDGLPLVVGFFTWVIALTVIGEPLRRSEAAAAVVAATPKRKDGRQLAAQQVTEQTRRAFVVRGVLVAAGAVVIGVAGRFVGAGKRAAEQSREVLKLTEVTPPVVPPATDAGLAGVAPWMTKTGGFYRIDTAFNTPAIATQDWSLRIHGMVDKEVTLTYDDLLERGLTQDWITLDCVSNPVGGNLISNGWFSGIRIAPILAELGVSPDADAVLQTSDDGWTCGTPLSALTDDRNAMLAIALNGEPLPLVHGFPVRTVVPGLYGYVSATKWVRDFEVTTFDKFTAFWTARGWGEMGPVKMSSRIDVPRSNASVPAGEVRVGGLAWSQHTGIAAVDVMLDAGQWQPATLATAPTVDTWVQWTATLPGVTRGGHTLKVRATDRDGLVQTSVVRDVLPDGSTGLHTIGFTAA